jgi:hypothetical protein
VLLQVVFIIDVTKMTTSREMRVDNSQCTNDWCRDACCCWCVDGRRWMHRHIVVESQFSCLSVFPQLETFFFSFFGGAGWHGEIKGNLRVIEKKIFPPFPLCSVRFLIDIVLSYWKGSAAYQPICCFFPHLLCAAYVRGFFTFFFFFF